MNNAENPKASPISMVCAAFSLRIHRRSASPSEVVMATVRKSWSEPPVSTGDAPSRSRPSMTARTC